MKTILDIRVKEGKAYFENGRITRFLDALKVIKREPIVISEIDRRILPIIIPPNFNREAYFYNISRVRGKFKNYQASVRGNRIYDLDYLSNFQKRILAFGIVKSIGLLLMNKQKSIRNSIIGIDDGGNNRMMPIIEECAKYYKRIVLISNNYKSANRIRSYIIANYGVSPELLIGQEDYKYIDFIISEKNKEYNSNGIWYLDNLYKPGNVKNIIVNDLSFSMDSFKEKFSPELLGILINQNPGKCEEIENFIKLNNIKIEEIRFLNGSEEINCY